MFDFSVYKRYTTDLLMSGVKIPSSTGFSDIANANVGKMENRGWEFNVSTKPIFKVGKFDVRLRANVAQSLNTVTEMDPTVLSSQNQQFDNSNAKYLSRVQLGHALGGIYGFRYKGRIRLRLRSQRLLLESRT